MNKDKIVQLQMLEQNLQNIVMQKQNFQAQISEIDNALKEVKQTKDQVFKVIGSTMIATNKVQLEKDLKSKQEILNLKIKTFEKQEKQFKEKFESLQAEVLKGMKK